MKIHRSGKQFAIVKDDTTIQDKLTFEEARSFLADQGNRDAQKPLVEHSNIMRHEIFIEPEFRGEYELFIGSDL